MAGRKLIIQGRVEASTILEVVVSMVIIILVFGTAMMIFSNVTRMSLSVKKIKAQAVLEETLRMMEQAKGDTTQSIVPGDFSIEKDVKPYGTGIHLSEVHLTAYDDNHQKVAELQKVIINPNE